MLTWAQYPKKVQTQALIPMERADAKNAFDGSLGCMRSAAEGSGESKGLCENLDPEKKERPKATTEEAHELHCLSFLLATD